jgi:hypothetical protein
MSQARRRVVIAGGTGPLGRALQQRLEADFDVLAVGTRAPADEKTWKADLLSAADAEIALAGAEIVVMLARTNGARARLVQAAAKDLDLLLADSIARAVTLTAPKRLVFFSCDEGDEREAVLRSSGVPLSIVSGGGDDPLGVLEQLVRAPGEETRRLPKWTGGAAPAAWSGGTSVLSVQRLPRKPGLTARHTVRAYFERLPKDAPTVKTVLGADSYEIRVAGFSAIRLRRLPGQCTDELEVLEVRDGALASTGRTASFEFRLFTEPSIVMVTLRGFVPALPWLVYRAFQAPMHARSMRRFGEWLATP